MFLIGIDWGLPGYSTWSNDDPTPIGPLKSAYQRFAGFQKYPPVHHALLAGVYAPYLGFLSVTSAWRDPQVEFPYGFTDPLHALSMLMLLARLVSVVMAIGIVHFVGRATARLFGDPRAAPFAMLVTLGNVYLVLFAHLGNVDVPALFWTALALVLLLGFLDRWSIRRAVALGAVASIALGTKEQVYSVFVGFALWITLIWLRDRRSWKPVAAGLVSAALVFAFVNNWLFAFDVWLERWEYWTSGGGTQPYIEVPATLAGQLSLLQRFVTYVVSGSGWPVMIWTLIGGVLLARDPRRLGVLLVPLIVYYVGSIASIRFAYHRFALPTLLFLAPLAGLALTRTWHAPGRARWLARTLVGGTMLFCVGWGARIDASLLLDSRYEAEAFLLERLPPPASVEVYAFDTYLPRLPELGYEVTRLIPAERPPADFSLSALTARRPAAVVLTSNYFTRFTSPELSSYFMALRGGPSGYTVYRFEGGPRWLGWRHGDTEFSRISPTLWVLVRRD